MSKSNQTFTSTTRNRIAAAALAGFAAAAVVAPAIAVVSDTASSTTVHAKPNGVGGSCSPFICGSTGNHNEVLTRSAR